MHNFTSRWRIYSLPDWTVQVSSNAVENRKFSCWIRHSNWKHHIWWIRVSQSLQILKIDQNLSLVTLTTHTRNVEIQRLRMKRQSGSTCQASSRQNLGLQHRCQTVSEPTRPRWQRRNASPTRKTGTSTASSTVQIPTIAPNREKFPNAFDALHAPGSGSRNCLGD